MTKERSMKKFCTMLLTCLLGILAGCGEDGATGPQGPAGTSGTGLAAFGGFYQLATIANATVVGGADVPLSNNGPLLGVTHTAGTTTMTVPSAGTYRVTYSAAITAGIGAALSVAVNGTVNASTNKPFLVAVGENTGVVLLQLSAGDVLTLRNNSAVPLTLALTPGVGAQVTIERLS